MAESKVIVNRPNSQSPPPNCAICLGTFTNKCFSDSCMHQFCFKCLLEWSKIKAECPLCKQPFRRIIHNVKSNEEYDEHVVEITPPEEIHIIDNEEYLFLPLGGTPQPPTRHHFHFRTTFTVDTRGEHAIQQMLLTHPLTNGGQISLGGYPSRNMYHRRRRDNTSTSFRRSIYSRNLWVNAPPDVTGRYRDVSPVFFRDCPGARTRLVPWLNRELNALLYENTQLVMRLVDIIMDHLLRHHICSRTFRNLLYEYLDNKTDHFIHEFYNFMRSPFDMIGYDRHVIYTEGPQSPPPYVVMLQDELSDDNDSDVIIVGSTNPEEPVVIDLVNTDSDEPILISQEEPPLPIPIPDRCSPVPEIRPPVLPIKLRLKHKRQRREKEKLRQRKRAHRHRSRSRSSSSSSSSTNSSNNSYKRYKRRKKLKKLTKRRQRSSSTESDVNVENTSSDSDVPLSTLASKKTQIRKYKKTLAHLFKTPKQDKVIPNTTKDIFINDLERLIPVVDEIRPNLPSCSRYNSDSSNTIMSQHNANENGLDLRVRSRQNNEDSSGSLNAPTCSKYTYSSYRSSPEGTNSLNLSVARSDEGTSAEDDYPLNHLVKSEVKDLQPDQKTGGPSGSRSVSSNGRLRNIRIKKEEATNMWYSYPCNYDSDSSTN